MRQSGPLVAAARIAVDEQFGSGVWGSRDTLRQVHDVAKRIGEMWIERGGRLLRGVETNRFGLIWSMLALMLACGMKSGENMA